MIQSPYEQTSVLSPLFVASVGLIAVAAVAVYYKKIESKLETKLVELEEEE